MNRLTWMVVIVVAIVLAVAIVGMVIYLDQEGTTPTNLSSGTKDILTPDQLSFPIEERRGVSSLLSARWQDPESAIMLMGRREIGGLIVLGATSTSSLNSAKMYLGTPDFQDTEKVKSYALAAQGGIYLVTEFKPTPEQQMLVASFYSSPIGTAVGDEFAVIQEINYETSQSGEIQAWSARFEKILVPFKGDTAFKAAALFID